MLEELKKCLKDEKKDNEIFDIVLYGSSVKGKEKPNDVDILVIFEKGTLKERLEKIQKIKKNIKIENKIDIKGILLKELFQEEFFARSGVFLEGVSLIDGKQFANKIGFNNAVLFFHNLKDKTHTEKVKFNYLISGRGGNGILKLMNGKQLAPGVLQIPLTKSLEFETILNRNKISYYKINVLIQK